MHRQFLYFVIISWFAITAYGGPKHLVCKEMEDIFTTEPSPRSHVSRRANQGFPGKRGPQGEKGETGDTGPQGPHAVVDYERIKTEVLERISSDIAALETKIDGLTSKIIDMDERLVVTDKRSHDALCDVFYNGKCFTTILHSTQDVNYAQAEELCSNIGWKLANIYDPTHYELIVDYLRTKSVSSRSWITACLGMTYNQQTHTILYSNGTTADVAGIKWYPRHPIHASSRVRIGIHVEKNPANTYQGIHTHPANGRRLGPICEL